MMYQGFQFDEDFGEENMSDEFLHLKFMSYLVCKNGAIRLADICSTSFRRGNSKAAYGFVQKTRFGREFSGLYFDQPLYREGYSADLEFICDMAMQKHHLNIFFNIGFFEDCEACKLVIKLCMEYPLSKCLVYSLMFNLTQLRGKHPKYVFEWLDNPNRDMEFVFGVYPGTKFRKFYIIPESLLTSLDVIGKVSAGTGDLLYLTFDHNKTKNIMIDDVGIII